MGSSADAHCENCGYSREGLVIGGSRSDFMTFAAWPVLCNSCQDVTSANMLAQPPTCEACGSTDVVAYGDLQVTRLLEPTETWASEIRWGELKIPNSESLCPKCRHWALRFTQGWMQWD